MSNNRVSSITEKNLFLVYERKKKRLPEKRDNDVYHQISFSICISTFIFVFVLIAFFVIGFLFGLKILGLLTLFNILHKENFFRID